MGENKRHCAECCSIDIHKLEEVLEPTANCCIYRVPQFLRKINEEAYSPRLISIGPLHYRSRDDLIGMEKQKRSYLSKFQQREEVGEQKLKDFKTYIEKEEKNIRSHYAVSSKLDSSEYVDMVLNDAVFIVELFLRKDRGTKDFLLYKSQLKFYIKLDLLLLENQLPYFVLNFIYSSAFPSSKSFWNLCGSFFNALPICGLMFPEETKIEHFTDLVRRYILPKEIPNSSKEASVTQESEEISDLPCAARQSKNGEILPRQSKNGEILPRQSKNGGILPSVTEESEAISDLLSATKLNESGLKFKRADEGKRLLEIKLRNKRKLWLPWLEDTEVEIPSIEIYDDIETVLRNLIALELFHYPRETYVCHYADLMNYLIDNANDVELLVEQRIVAKCVGDYKQIAKMFNSLTSCIVPSPNCYYEIAEHMKKHYKNPLNHLKATLNRVYFHNLWKGTATVAAILLLFLTLIQTVFPFMQIKLPSS